MKTLSNLLNNNSRNISLLTCSDDSISDSLFDESSLSTSIASLTSDRQSLVICKYSDDNEPENVNNNGVQKKTALDNVTDQ